MSDNLSKSIFEEDIVIDDFIRDEFMEKIFSNISDILDDKYVSSFEIPVATHMAMLKIQKMIDLALIDHDGKYSSTEPLEVLRPDAEPIPNMIDSWARGTVKIKKISAEDKIPHLPNESNNSISSGYTSTKGDRSSKGGTSRLGMRSRGANPGRPMTDDDTGKIIDSDDPDGEFANLSLTATAHMFDLLQKKKRQIDLGYVEKDTEKGEFTLIQEQMEKASKELKGKKFTLDRYGKPVVIGAVNPEKLVPFSTKIVPSIKSVEAGEQNDITNTTIATTSTSNAPATSKNVRSNSLTSNGTQQSLEGKSKDKKKQFVRVAGSRAIDESSFKPTLSLAVTLSGVEQIPKLNPGVSLRNNATVRIGDKLPEDPKHISRKQYESQTLSRRSTGLNDNSTIESPNQILESSSFYTNTEQASKLNGNLHLSTNKSHGNKVTSLKSLDSLPDIDSLEGSHLIEPSDGHLYQELSDEELGLGPIKAIGGSPVNTRLPGKPTPQQVLNSQLITGSPENGRPRDRDLPKNMVSVSERRHLPAPSMGQITGHGMPIEKFQERKNYVDSSPNDKWTQEIEVLLKMSQLLISIESSPYDVSNIVKLEAAVVHQLTNKMYDFNVNKMLLKSYQVNVSSIKPELISSVLILSLMRLNTPDFLSMSYLIPTYLMTNNNIITIRSCADLLERGKFREFWELFVLNTALFSEAQGFVDYIRVYIISNLRDTFKNIHTSLFQQYLGLDDNSVILFCNTNKSIEKISGDFIDFVINDENQNRSQRDESLKMEEGIKLVGFLRTA